MTDRAQYAWMHALKGLHAYRPEGDDAIYARTSVAHAAQARRAKRDSGLFFALTVLVAGGGYVLGQRGDEDLMNLSILLGIVGLVLTLRALLNCQPEPRSKAHWLCMPVAESVAAEHLPGMMGDPDVRLLIDRWVAQIGTLRHIELDELTQAYPAWLAQCRGTFFPQA